jgi:hypothetical protein
MSYEASLASASGNNTQAISLLRQAQSVSPENEDIATLLTNVKRASLGASNNFVKLDHSYRGLGKNDEQITTLSGAVRASDHVELGFNAQNNELDTDNTRRASDGAFGDYSMSRQRGELYGAYNFIGGERLQTSLFANNDTLGGRLSRLLVSVGSHGTAC